MYVKDVKDGKRTYTHIFVFLIFNGSKAMYVEGVKDVKYYE